MAREAIITFTLHQSVSIDVEKFEQDTGEKPTKANLIKYAIGYRGHDTSSIKSGSTMVIDYQYELFGEEPPKKMPIRRGIGSH